MKNTLDVNLPKIKKVRNVKKPTPRVRPVAAPASKPATKKPRATSSGGGVIPKTKVDSALKAHMAKAISGKKVSGVKAVLDSPVDVIENLSALAATCILRQYSDAAVKREMLSGVTDIVIKRSINKSSAVVSRLANNVREEAVNKVNVRVARTIDGVQKKAAKSDLSRADLKVASDAIRDAIIIPVATKATPKPAGKAAKKAAPAAKKAGATKRKKR